jgi:hypothetical protein
MTRYFFDVMSGGRCERDSHGTLFSDPEEARKWARLFALTLEVSGDEQELVGGRIGVRDRDGRELFSIPIRRLEAPQPVSRSRADHLRDIDAVSGSIFVKVLTAMRSRLSGAKTPRLASDDETKVGRYLGR